MFGNSKILVELGRVKQVVDDLSTAVALLAEEVRTRTSEVELLREQLAAACKREQLAFDRLMSRNFEEFAINNLEADRRIEDQNFKIVPPEFEEPWTDEELAGTIYDDLSDKSPTVIEE